MVAKNVVVAIEHDTVLEADLQRILTVADEKTWTRTTITATGRSFNLLSKTCEEEAVAKEVADLSAAVPDESFTPGSDRWGSLDIITGDFVPDALLVPSNARTALAFADDQVLGDVLTQAKDVISAPGPAAAMMIIKPSSTPQTPPTDPGGESKPDKKAGGGAEPEGEPPTSPPELKELHPALWEALADKPAFAKAYLESVVSARITEQSADRWKGEAQRVLIDKLGEADDTNKKLIRQVVRVTAGLPDVEGELYAKAVETEGKRNELLAQAVRAATTLNDQLDGWKVLRDWAIGLMVTGTVFAVVMTIWLVNGRDLRSLEGYLLPILIFVFAVMAVSPAVLLLLGRPLAGIDQFLPGGKAEALEKAAEKPKADEAKADK